MTSRGQTAVLGLVLLIGVVAISSIGILLVAGQTTTEFQQQSETDRVESAFVELSQQMAEASTKSDVSKAMDLAAGEQGAVAKKDTGWITIESDDLEEPLNLSIGTIEYVGDDGTRIAYQAGGVWRETGNETRTVSTPPIHYNRASETFTFPVVTVSGEQTLGSGDVRIAHNGTGTFENATVVEDSSIDITIKSEYYRGWQQYFERQTGDASIRDVDHDEQTLQVRLGHIDIEDSFDSGVTLSAPPGEQGNADYGDPIVRHGSIPELDAVIYEMVGDMESGDYSGDFTRVETINESETFTNGTYFANEVDLDSNDHEVVFDLSDGNATLIVDGDVSLSANDAKLRVENTSGTDHDLKIYSTGNLDISGQVNPDREAARTLQVYGTSQMYVALHGGTFVGTIYAPSNDFEGTNPIGGRCDDEQVCMHSNVEFTGALIAESAHFQGGWGSFNFTYDDSLENSDIDLYPEDYILPPQLTYLNVAHHEVDVENA